MLVKLIHTNKPGAYGLMLLVLIVLWIVPMIISPVIISERASMMPLWNIFSFIDGYSWIALLLGFVSAIIIILSLTRFNSKYALLSKQSVLPGFIYILLTGIFPNHQIFNPIWLVAILFVISLDYLFSAYNMRKTMKDCFIASFILSLASLFSYQTLLLIPLLFVSMILLRLLTFKSFLASLLGVVLPWMYLWGYELALGDTSNVLIYLQPSADKILNGYNHTLVSIVIIAVVILIFIFSLFSILNTYGKKKIFTRKQYQVFVFAGIYLLVLMAVTGPNMVLMPLLAIPFAMIIAHFIDNISSWLWQNIILSCLVVSMIIGKLFLY